MTSGRGGGGGQNLKITEFQFNEHKMQMTTFDQHYKVFISKYRAQLKRQSHKMAKATLN